MSKFSKFRHSPEQFFADSRHAGVRAAGRVLAPGVFRRELVRAVLEEPLEGLSRGGIPGLSDLAARQLRWASAKRRSLLEAAGTPRVTVVMAARNAEGFVEGSLASLLGQTYGELEVFVVDDASDDRTSSIVASITERDARVELLRNTHPRGAAVARNVGLSRARGRYITFQDADDVSHPVRIERQLAALLRRPGAVACECNYCRETAGGKRVVVNGRRFAKSAISVLFARTPVLTRLGYLLDASFGEDREYPERIRAYFGPARVTYLFETLYRARFSRDSLLFSNGETTTRSSDEVLYSPSEHVQRENARLLKRIEQIRAGSIEPYVAVSGESSTRREAPPVDDSALSGP